MIRTVSTTLVLLLGLQAAPSAQAGDSTSVRKCIGALNAFETEVGRDGRSGVAADWIKGTRGWLLLTNSLGQKAEDELRRYVGNTKEISFCAASGVSSESINLFLKAFHGYLSGYPLEDVSRCYAVLMVAAPELDRVLGRQRAQSFGLALGKGIGATVVQLGYLFPSQKRTLQQVEARATTIASSLSTLKSDSKAALARSYLSQCGLHNVPLQTVLEGAGVSVR